MALIPAGTGHWLWTKFLIACGSPLVARWPLRMLGMARWAVQPGNRRLIERRFAELADIAREAGHRGALVSKSPRQLAKRHFVDRALLGVTPALATAAPQGYVDALIDARGFDKLEHAAASGRGLVVAGTHYGSMGITAAYLSRRGYRVIILRDQQFRHLKGTPHGSQFFLGAEPIFLDINNPASVTRALISCAHALKQGAVIAYTLDARHGTHSREGELLGRKVELRTALLELALRCSSAITYGFSYVEQGKVRFGLADPVTIVGADRLEQWCVEFCREWEQVIVHHPEAVSWSRADLELICEISAESAEQGARL